MSTGGERIDWDAVKRQLAAAGSALDNALVAGASRIDEVYRQRAAQMAKRHTERAAIARTITLLVFSLGAETYALPMGDLAEVLPSTQCTPAPRAAAEIAGVINLRGDLRSVIDLRLLLSVPESGEGSAESILMLRNRGGEVGLKVGRIEKVQTLREEDLATYDAAGAGGPNAYVKGLSPDKVIVLDAAALRLHPVFKNH